MTEAKILKMRARVWRLYLRWITTDETFLYGGKLWSLTCLLCCGQMKQTLINSNLSNVIHSLHDL